MTNYKESKAKTTKRYRLHVGDPDFEPPDGGWGWVICFAVGFAGLCLYPIMQQFGLLFKDKFKELGIPASQTSTIINTNTGLTSLMGLLNGPLFRAFSYRKVSIIGALICSISIAILSLSYSFTEYIIVYSIFYGIGMGFAVPANALALNTYFLEKRRMATGLSWTATAFGPIIMPQLISFLLPIYGVEGTTLIFAGFAGNAIVAACLLHPVHWHTKFRKKDPESGISLLIDQQIEKPAINFDNKEVKMHKSASFISTQYVFNEDDPTTPGYEIIYPGTPMLCAGNDGLFTPSKRSICGSKQSLTSSLKRCNYFEIDSKRASTQNLALSRNYSANNMLSKSLLHTNDIKKDKRKVSSTNNPHKIEENADEEQLEQSQTNSGEVLQKACEKLEQLVSEQSESLLKDDKQIKVDETSISFWQKLVIFFDLDLLKDLVYVNIMIGVTLAWFAELNFSIFTPFVLHDFGFTNQQTAMFMSIVAVVDIFVRFATPFAAAKIDLDNRTFFLIGIMSLAMGRVFLCATQTYRASLAIAVLIGFGKGLRTIFMALAIPSHVPLTRLPAATGLQLLTGGCISLACGPLVGWIRDITENYVLTLHFINILTFTTTISWVVEKLVIRKRERKQKSLEINSTNNFNKS